MRMKRSKVTKEEKKWDKNCGVFRLQTIRQLLPPESLLSAIGNTNFVSRSNENTANISYSHFFLPGMNFFYLLKNTYNAWRKNCRTNEVDNLKANICHHKILYILFCQQFLFFIRFPFFPAVCTLQEKRRQ